MSSRCVRCPAWRMRGQSLRSCRNGTHRISGAGSPCHDPSPRVTSGRWPNASGGYGAISTLFSRQAAGAVPLPPAGGSTPPRGRAKDRGQVLVSRYEQTTFFTAFGPTASQAAPERRPSPPVARQAWPPRPFLPWGRIRVRRSAQRTAGPGAGRPRGVEHRCSEI